MPTTSEIKNADDIELQSMTEKTIESVHTIDTSFIDNDVVQLTNFPEREMKALDKKLEELVVP